MAKIMKAANGTWAYKATIGTGKNRQQPYKSGFKTKKEATKAAAELEVAGKRTDLTMPEYFDRWIKLYKLGRHSAVTDEWYQVVSGYIHDYFDTRRIMLADMDRMAYQAFLDWCGTNPRGKRQKPLSRSTVTRINSYIKSMVQDAIEDNYATRDFTRRAIISGTPSKDESKKYVSLEEFRRMITLAEQSADLSHMSNYIAVCMGYTGARFEEALGLTWDNIDFEAHTVTFAHSWRYKTRKQTDNFGPLKNPQSYRTIPIPERLTTVLKKLQQEQRVAFVKDGWRDPDNLVFRNAEHRIITNEAMSKMVKDLCEAAGAKNTITSHGLRHSHGSMLLYEGVELMSISKRLGHASLAITMRVYLHEIDEAKQRNDKQTIDALEKL